MGTPLIGSARIMRYAILSKGNFPSFKFPYTIFTRPGEVKLYKLRVPLAKLLKLLFPVATLMRKKSLASSIPFHIIGFSNM